MESKIEDQKVYINEKLLNQDAKLKDICYSLLEEVKTEKMEEVKIIKLRSISSNHTGLSFKNKSKNSEN